MALNKLFADSSKQLDIYARKGVILNENILAVDSAGDPFDLSTYTATLTVYDPEDKTTSIITPTITMNDGSIDIDASAAVMDIASNNYYYELVVSLPSSGGDEVWLTGNFIVNDGIFESGTSASSITINTGVASTSVTLSVNTNGAPAGIGNLTDVTLTNLSDNEILSYDSASGKWINEAPSSGVSTLDALTDTTITDNSAGEILKWNGSAWVNNTLAEAGIAGGISSLDEAYDGGNEITIDTNATPFTLLGGTGVDTDSLISFKNNSGLSRLNIYSDGNINWTTVGSIQNGGVDTIDTDASNNVIIPNGSFEVVGGQLIVNNGSGGASGISIQDSGSSEGTLFYNNSTNRFIFRAFSGNDFQIQTNGGNVGLTIDVNQNVEIPNGDLEVSGAFGINGASPLTKPTITGSTAGNAALQNLLTELANYGLITDSTT